MKRRFFIILICSGMPCAYRTLMMLMVSNLPAQGAFSSCDLFHNNEGVVPEVRIYWGRCSIHSAVRWLK